MPLDLSGCMFIDWVSANKTPRPCGPGVKCAIRQEINRIECARACHGINSRHCTLVPEKLVVWGAMATCVLTSGVGLFEVTTSTIGLPPM